MAGPGGAGKGTVAARLVAADPTLWLSRSWTTRARRPGESPDAYVFVDRPTFLARVASGGFLEWAEFLGELYGTPVPDPPAGKDVLLEIDLQGARQIRALDPGALVILLVPPSEEVQEARLRARGDDEAAVARRIATGRAEVAGLREICDAVVVNDEVDRAVAEILGILEQERRRRRAPIGASVSTAVSEAPGEGSESEQAGRPGGQGTGAQGQQGEDEDRSGWHSGPRR
ncbi:guanylate kinase [Aciditerrimonas ferrireducens]|uniref:Guanylate kinase n=1 Tax=Aciditerrimonas ferrireducens TaxID=667306 RepID=A0ABV6CA02_9ACTN